MKKLLKLFMLVALISLAMTFTKNQKVLAASLTWDGGGSDSNLATAANWAGDSAPSDGDTLIFNNSSSLELTNDLSTAITINGITLTGTTGVTIDGPNTLHLQGMVHPTGDASFIGFTSDVSLDGATTFDGVFTYMDGVVSGSGDLAVGANTAVVLSNDNPSYTGQVNITSNLAVVHVNTSNSLGDSNTGTVVSDGGILAFCTDSSDLNVAEPLQLSGHSSVTGTLTVGKCAQGGAASTHKVTLTGQVTVGSDVVLSLYNDLYLSTAISGNLPAVSANSTGVLHLSNGQTVSGSGGYTTITVSDINGCPTAIGAVYKYVIDIDCSSVSGFASSLIVSGMLSGTGKVGVVSVNLGGVLAPGNSPGILSTGDLSFNGGTYQVEIAGAGVGEFDQIDVTGSVTLENDAVLQVTHLGGFKPSAGQSFVIINNDGTDAVTGTFMGLPQGASFTIDGVTYTISYTGGDGNDVELTAIPLGTNTGSASSRMTTAQILVVGVVVPAGAALLKKKLRVLRRS